MKTSLRIALLSALLMTAAPGVALADEPYAHDGFYLRLGLGVGYLHDSITLKGVTSNTDFSIKGFGIPLEIALGGTIAPGLVLGGAIQGGSFPNPTAKFGGISGDLNTTAVLSSIGPFVDYYPDPRGGLHFQGFVGYGVIGAQDDDGDTSSDNPKGVALSAGVGHEWFVSQGWSIGVLGRLQYAHLTWSSGGAKETDSVISPGVLASFTYH